MKERVRKYYIFLQTMFGTDQVEMTNAYDNKYVFKVEEDKHIVITNLGDGNWQMEGFAKQ